MTPDELATKYPDVIAAEKLRRAQSPNGASDDQLLEHYAPQADPHQVDNDHNPLDPWLITWHEFWDADLDDQEWLLEPLFAQRRSHALYAGAKTGKSYLVLAACAALATGKPFLDQPKGDPQHVLYVDYEMTLEDLRDRLAEFGYGPNDDLTHLHYALLPSLPPLDTDAGGHALVTAAQAVNAKFVIIDTTSRAISGNENDADTMRAFYRHTGLKLKQAGIGWMRLDHSGKDGTKGQRGTSAKNDDVDVVVRLERTDNGLRLTATHRRMSWYPETKDIAVVEPDGIVLFANVISATTPGWPAGTKEAADLLDTLNVPLDASARKASQALRDAGHGRRDKVVRAAVKHRQQTAQLAVDNFVDNPTKPRPEQAGRGQNDDRGPKTGTRSGRGQNETENPAPTKGTTAAQTDGTHRDAP